VDQTETSFTPPLLVYADLIQTGSLSKAGLNAVTRMLAGDMKADGVLVNSICPGWTATDMGGAGGRPVEEGADGIVWAATLPDSGPTGGFFKDGVPLPW
jgi:NAD(P)-dependent dehydrogenase (short-subunit alcohol dehydrogenase family)